MVDAAALDHVLEVAVEEGLAPGVVALVGGPEVVTYLGSAGRSEVGTGQLMTTDTMFRVASFTKVCVAIAVLRLVEQGRLDLATEVADILPAARELMVLEGFDGDRPRLRPPVRPLTLRHLMTHTSGLTYDTFSEDLGRYMAMARIPSPGQGSRDCFRTPLIFDPGERFAYGMSTDWTGQVVEAVTGERLDHHLANVLFGPLFLADVTFTPGADQRARLAPVHARTGKGHFEVVPFEYPVEPEFFSGGHGLYATASDWAVVQQLLLNRGTARGVRILQEPTVARMTSDQLAGYRMPVLPSTKTEFSHDLTFPTGTGWGLDVMVTRKGEPGLRPAGSFGWCGTFNTFYWVDPVNKLVAALYTQYLPFFDPGALELLDRFEREVYRS